MNKYKQFCYVRPFPSTLSLKRNISKVGGNKIANLIENLQLKMER